MDRKIQQVTPSFCPQGHALKLQPRPFLKQSEWFWADPAYVITPLAPLSSRGIVEVVSCLPLYQGVESSPPHAFLFR